VSVDKVAKLLKLTNQKLLADGSVLEKIERYSLEGVETDFFKDGERMTQMIPRLNDWHNSQNWISMRPGGV
jgi:hypothetical protein